MAQRDATSRFGRATSLYATLYTQSLLRVSHQINQMREADQSLTPAAAQDLGTAGETRFQTQNAQQLGDLLRLAAALQQYGDALSRVAEARSADLESDYLSRTGRGLWVASKAFASVPTPGSTLTLVTVPAEERFRRKTIERMLAADAPEVSRGVQILVEELDVSRPGSVMAQYSSEVEALSRALKESGPPSPSASYCERYQTIAAYGLVAGNRDYLERYQPEQRDAGLSLVKANGALAAIYRGDSRDLAPINSFADSVGELNIAFQLEQ